MSQVPQALQKRVIEEAPDLFRQLWKPLCDEADHRAMRAVEQLKARGRKEADQLRALLSAQRSAIERSLRDYENDQLSFADLDKQERAQRQAEATHMRGRLKHIDDESKTQPEEIEALYQVALKRLTPVGLVVLWPSTRA